MSVIKKFIFIFLLLLVTTKVWCQLLITGQVISREDKSPLPGVQIIEKGTQNGTQSKQDGTFSISVSEVNATLVFSFIGMTTQEYHLKGATQILVNMKYDCIRCFFDVQRIGIYANSGVLNNPVGGQLYLTFPHIYGAGMLNSSFSFQSNLRNNQFLNVQIEFSHFVLSCDFDMNARWHYREISYNNNFRSKTYTFEADFNFGRGIWFLPFLGVIVGYGNLKLNNDKPAATGPLFGLRTYIGRYPFSAYITGKAAIFKNNIELQGNITRDFRHFNIFIKYYHLQPFSELSLGIGKEFGYRLKKQRMKK